MKKLTRSMPLRTALASLGLAVLLAGCDGATITITPHSSSPPSDSSSQISSTTQSVSSQILSSQVSSSSSSDKPTVCDTRYAPVCAAVEVQCVTEPCYPVHQTFGNLCEAGLEDADFLFEGQCGELEGKPVKTETSSSSSSVDICDSDMPPPGAPGCWKIISDPCFKDDCSITYEISDYCGVRGQNAQLIFEGYDPERCDALNQTTSPDLCEQLNGLSYYSEALGEGGLTPNGIVKRHWQIHFRDGLVSFDQSDFAITGTYACRDNQVIITSDQTPKSEHVLDIDNNLETLRFDILGTGEVTYRQGKNTYPKTTACSDVSGHRYSSDHLSNNNNFSQLDITQPDLTQPEQGPTFFDFAKSPNKVTMGYGDIVENGYYVCDLGELHVHLDGRKGDPIVIKVNRHGVDITVLGENPYTLPRVEDPIVCPLYVAPVCAAQEVQCVTEPCFPVHKTFSNSCFAGDAPILFEGECGDLEGKPVLDEPIICTKEYAPVCAAVEVQCFTEPCYPIHQTFGNLCEAGGDNANIIFEGECGELEGQPVEEEPVACIALFDPVCAKAQNPEVQCVTEPCPNYEYTTFGNSCEAGVAKAQFSFKGQCSDLDIQGQLTTSEPPVILDIFPVDTHPNGEVSVMSSSIEGDILTVKLGYSGCDVQPINFRVSTVFLESNPVQANTLFTKNVDDACEAYFTETYHYDLLPLKAAYQAAYQTSEGIIILRDVTTYQF